MKKQIQKTHEKAMTLVGELRHLNRYSEANDLMRLSSCAHLQLLDQKGVKEQGIDDYYDMGDVLLSSAEDFGYRKNKSESYKAWDKRTKDKLKDYYKCEITGEYCVSREIGFHASNICEGDNNEVYAQIDIQIRCPAFKYREGLIERLGEIQKTQ